MSDKNQNTQPSVNIQGLTIGGALGEALAKLQIQLNSIVNELGFVKSSISNVDALMKLELKNIKKDIEDLKKKVLD